jgi:hypothetical protein
MTNQIGIGTKFQTSYRGMSVSSRDTMVYESWEVVDILEDGYHCELRSSDAVMESNQSFGKFFDESTIINALRK